MSRPKGSKNKKTLLKEKLQKKKKAAALSKIVSDSPGETLIPDPIEQTPFVAKEAEFADESHPDYEGRNKSGMFQPGNQFGRLQKSLNGGTMRKYRSEFSKHVPEAIERLVYLMRTGESEKIKLAAASKIIDMVVPPCKEPLLAPQDVGIDFNAVTTLASVETVSHQILSRFGDGTITHEEAQAYFDKLLSHNRVVEIVKVDPIIEAYERRKHQSRN